MTASASTAATRRRQAPRGRRRARALVALALGLVALPARGERIVAEMSSRVVRITSNFNGVTLTLFGTVEDVAAPPPAGYDVVVTVTGPRESSLAFQKARKWGIWVNARSRTFVNVPSYLAVLSTRPVDSIAPAATLQHEEVGIDNIALRLKFASRIVVTAAPEDPFRRAFVRLKGERGLYEERADGARFLTPSLYRAGIFLPAAAPVGSYDVDVKLFAGGSLVARTRAGFELRTVGFEQFIASAAVNHGIAYGLATALMAVMTGWLASVVFRRE